MIEELIRMFKTKYYGKLITWNCRCPERVEIPIAAITEMRQLLPTTMKASLTKLFLFGM